MDNQTYSGYAIDEANKLIYYFESDYKTRASVLDNVARCVHDQTGLEPVIDRNNIITYTLTQDDAGNPEEAAELETGEWTGYEIFGPTVQVTPKRLDVLAEQRDAYEMQEQRERRLTRAERRARNREAWAAMREAQAEESRRYQLARRNERDERRRANREAWATRYLAA